MIHLTGSDLAVIYAAALRQSRAPSAAIAQSDAREAMQDFMRALERIDGRPPQVGDAFLLNADPRTIPNGDFER